MKSYKFLSVLFLLLSLTASRLQAQEPYAVLDNSVLTFYYDNQKDARSGMDLGPFANADYRGWNGAAKSITKVVFDSSMDSYKGLTSTAFWFWDFVNLEEVVDIQYLHTDSVRSMESMFGIWGGTNYQNPITGKLPTVDMTHFNTSNVENMNGVFSNCANLTSLDLSSFDTRRVTDMSTMFAGCTSLTTINVGPYWTTDAVENSSLMFRECTSLVGGAGTTFNPDYIDKTYARVDRGTASPGYLTGDAADWEPYAVLSDSNTVLTFYYDDQKAARGGMSVGPFDDYQERGWHEARENITTVVFDDSFANCTSITSTAYWFCECSNLLAITRIANLNTSNVTDMIEMFYGCYRLASLDLSHFDTSNVTDMKWMFFSCSALTSLDLSSFNTSNVTNMDNMFYGCSSLTSLDLSGFNTSNVTDMAGMFYDCFGLTSLDLSHFNTSNVGIMDGMFSGCSGLTSLDVSNFNTSNVTDMNMMFAGCSGLTSLDVSNFNTSNVTNMGVMFYDCSGLTSLDLSNFNTSNVTNMGMMFYDCSGLTSLDLSNFNTSNVTDMRSMFGGCSELTSLDVSNFNTSNVTNMNYMFGGCSELTSLDVSNFNTSNVTNMNYMFGGCSGLTSLDLSGFSTSNVTQMDYMFYGCSSLTSLDVSHFNTSNVTDMSSMFRGCSTLTSLDLSSFNTSKVTDMTKMFENCYALTSLNLGNFDTSNVTRMEEMLKNCSSLTSLDLSGFNTSNVTDMFMMFYGCSALATIYVGDGWSTNIVTNSSIMFEGCTNLVGGAGTVYDENHTDYTYAHIDGGTANPGYFTDKNAPAIEIAAPKFSFSGNDLVMSSETEGAMIYYRMQGYNSSAQADSLRNSMTVDTQNTLYQGPVPVTQNVVVKAVAFLQGQGMSEVTTMVYDYDAWRSLLDAIAYADNLVTRADGVQMPNDSLQQTLEGKRQQLTMAISAAYGVYQDRAAREGSNAWNIATEITQMAQELENLLNYAVPAAPEAYALLSDNNTVLTFYYDFQKAARGGMDVRAFDYTFGGGMLDSSDRPGWYDYRSGVTRVVFDPSFANCLTVTSTAIWFLGFSSLTSVEGLENLRTEGVTDMSFMFFGCTALTSLDLTTFYTANVTKMSGMFYGCTHLTTIYAGYGWFTDAVAESDYMFASCSNLVGGAGTSFDGNHTDIAYAHIDGGTANPGYFTGKDNSLVAYYPFNGNANDESGHGNDGEVIGNVVLTTDRHGNANGAYRFSGEPFSYISVPDNETLHLNVFTLSAWVYTDTEDYNYGYLVNKGRDIEDGSYHLRANGVGATNQYGGENDAYIDSIPATGIWHMVTGTVEGDQAKFYLDGKLMDERTLSVPFTYNGTEPLTLGMHYYAGVPEDWAYSLTGVLDEVRIYNRVLSADEIRELYGDYEAPAEPEPYAVLSNNTVLTFYYDDQKAARGGMSVGPFTNAEDNRGWSDNSNLILSVVFDDSFANCSTLSSTACWFLNCSNLSSITGLNNLNTENVTDMSYMFYNTNLEKLNVSGFNTSNVTNMSDMFYDCSRLTSLDVSNFNTSNVTNMNYMFGGCSELTSLDVTNFNTSYVTSMYGMFIGCSGLTSLDVSNFNTSNVTNMYTMFGGCSGLTSLDVSNFNTSSVTNMNAMFGGCSSLATIYAGNGWNIDAVTEGFDMFTGCTNLVGGAGTAYDANHTDYIYAHIDGGTANPGYFTDKNTAPAIAEAYAVLSDSNTVLTFYYDDQKVARGGMSVGPFDEFSVRWNGHAGDIKSVVFDDSFANCTSITSTRLWFCDCSNLRKITGIGNLNTSNVTNMNGMFAVCTSLTSLDVSNFNTSNVTDMNSMFLNCDGLTSLDVSNFNTSKVTEMAGMFYGCYGLTSLDVSNFNTSNVTDMSGMFYGCFGLTSLDVSHFDTSNVTKMGGMFCGCFGLTSLDVSHFDTSNATRMNWMFGGCSGLTSLELSNFNTENVTDMHNMFDNCSRLRSLDLSNFNTSNVTDMSNMFSDCTSLACIQAGNAAIPDNNYAEIGNPNLLVYVNQESLAPQSVQNVVVNGTAKNIVLTDTEEGNNNFYCPVAFTAENIEYTHEYRMRTEIGVSRGWETIALPFTVQTIRHEKNGLLTPFGSGQEGKPFWLRTLTSNGLTAAHGIEANVPYLISMPNNAVYPADYNQAGRVTFSAQNTVVPVTQPKEASNGDRILVPTFMSVYPTADIYAVNRNAAFETNPEGSVFVAAYREVRTFEAYALHPNGNARLLSIDELMEGDADFVDILQTETAEEVSVYDLSGKLVGKGRIADISKRLPRGIYIVNGKKVVIK